MDTHACLVVDHDATAAGQRAGALAAVTVTYQDNSDRPVAGLLAREDQARGRYLIDNEIARGGMGAVLRGIDRDIRREIAVKIMLDDSNPHKQARFVEEAQITGQLEHPNIVPVHERGLDEQGRPFFTMKMVKGRSLIDQRSDVYALGGLLYAMLTLQPPVEKGGGQAALLMRVAQGEIVPPEERIRRAGGVSPRSILPELSAIAMKALAKEPKDRYQTAEAFRRDLELYQAGYSVSARHDTFREQAWKLIKRNKGASIATAVAAAVLLVVAGIFLKVNYDARVAAEEARKQADDNYAAFQESVRKSVPAFVKSARLATENRDFDDARNQMAAALAADPNHADARLLKAQLLIVAQDFAAAVGELEQSLKARPKDERSRRLRELCREARPDDLARLVPIASVLVEQGASPLVDGLLRKYGRDSNEVRQVLLKMYRERIEKAWPGKRNKLTIDARGLHQVLRSDEGITDLTPLKGMPLPSLNCYNTQVSDLTPLAEAKFQDLRFTPKNITRGLDVIRAMPSLKTLGISDVSNKACPAEEFWQRLDKGEFK